MTVNGGHDVAWFTAREWACLTTEHVDRAGLQILEAAKRRAENAKAFGVFDRRTCPECLQLEEACGCSLRDSRVLSFRAREDWEP